MATQTAVVATFSNGDALTANTEVTACLPDDHETDPATTITNGDYAPAETASVAVSVDRGTSPKVVGMFVYGDDEHGR